MPAKYPERQYRRPQFDAEGPAVRLADGQDWTFPRVRLSHRLTLGQAGAPSLAPTARVEGSLPESVAYTEALQSWIDGDGNFYARTLDLAWRLLAFNYDLPAAASGDLFAFDEPDEGEVPPLVAALVPILQGRRPKSD